MKDKEDNVLATNLLLLDKIKKSTDIVDPNLKVKPKELKS